MKIFWRLFFLLLPAALYAFPISEKGPQAVIRLSPELCVGDTACYRYQYHAYQLAGTDTLCIASQVRDFRLAVTDSTPCGYTVEYTLLNVFSKDEDNKDLSGLLSNHFMRHLKGLPLLFTYNPQSGELHMKDWKALSEQMSRMCSLMLDEVYRTETKLLRNCPRDSVERMIASQYNTESHVLYKLLRAMPFLFGFNGMELPLGWTRETYRAAGDSLFEMRSTLFADTLSPGRPGGDPYGGILANARTQEVIPVTQVMERRGAQVWGERVLNDPLIMPFVNDAIENSDAAHIKVTHDRMLSFFFSGWPKEFLLTRTARYISGLRLKSHRTRIEQDYLVWLRMRTGGEASH